MTLVAGELCLQFDRADDRVSHAILIGDSEVPLLDSLEGESDAAWPSSPPLQELTLESRGNRQIAFLVGKAGTSHWSASIEIAAERDEFVFDVACRVQQPPGWLGSRYRLPDQAGARSENGRIIVVHGDQILEIAGSAAIETMSVCEAIAGEVTIAASAASAPFPSTIRWRYTVSRMLSPPIAADLSE